LKFFKLPASHALVQNLALMLVVGVIAFVTRNPLALCFLLLIPSLPAFMTEEKVNAYGDSTEDKRDEEEVSEYGDSHMGFTSEVK
jgi:hypothetical protein